MTSIHAKRWIENFEHSDHDLYWYDILGRGKFDILDTVTQILNTSKRKLPYIKGEYLLSKRAPRFYSSIRHFLEVTENEALEKIIKEIKPDVIHSFEMQSCTYPIVKTMNKFPDIKWIYSCWGSDLYFYQDFVDHKKKIEKALKRINYLHTDCLRDYYIAKKLGFTGRHLEVIPGGTGYKLEKLEAFKQPLDQRKIILIKGYQNLFSRGINIVKAIQELRVEYTEYQVVVFGAHPIVQNYVFNSDLNYKVYKSHELLHEEVIELMGKSLVYIGNNISDGMANTLLEAIVMGAFPIQSNPGNVTAEIIDHGVNGFLIEDPENINSIRQLIVQALDNREMIMKASKINEKIASEKLEFSINQQKVLDIYKNLEINIKCE